MAKKSKKLGRPIKPKALRRGVGVRVAMQPEDYEKLKLAATLVGSDKGGTVANFARTHLLQEADKIISNASGAAIPGKDGPMENKPMNMGVENDTTKDP